MAAGFLEKILYALRFNIRILIAFAKEKGELRIPCHTSQQDVTIIKAIPGLQCPKGTQERQEHLPSTGRQTAATPCGEPRELRTQETQDTCPGELRCR